MSKQERTYTLNVARQFLQGLPENPLRSRTAFNRMSLSQDKKVFFQNLVTDASHYLSDFEGIKLQRILSAGLSRPESFSGDRTRLIRTAMIDMGPDIKGIFTNANGESILRSLAALSLLAAAYDLCYAEHCQGGIKVMEVDKAA